MNRVAAFLFKIYRNLLSPHMLHGCRFIPSCSEYARDAMTALSLRQAALKILWRICRCHPWSPAGYDPVMK